jgi:hypothetical protein
LPTIAEIILGQEESVQGLVGEPEGKTPLGRLRSRWDLNRYFGENSWGVEWIQLA